MKNIDEFNFEFVIIVEITLITCIKDIDELHILLLLIVSFIIF